MKIILSDFDAKRIEQLNVTMQNNAAIFEVMADYINNNEQFITQQMLQPFVTEYDMPSQTAYSMLLASACGLEIAEKESHKILYENYFVPAVKLLNPQKYLNNPYLKTITFPEIEQNSWKISKIKFQPCEAFVYNQPLQTSDFREIPQIGFFENEVSFPAVFQNNREWMSLKPNEIETMEQPIENANGNILVYGLGLGYFAFMASQKNSVKKLTIIEKDSEIIKLFENQLFNQFPNKNKIDIICADAIEYAQKEAAILKPDYVFADIWHDVGDGLSIYLKLRTLEKNIPNATFDYWIEKSMLSNLRAKVFFQMYNIFKNNNPKSQEYEIIIKDYNSFINKISDENLKNIKINFK